MEKAFLKFTAQFYNMHYSNSCLPCPGVPFLRAYATLLARNSDDLTSRSLTEASARIRAGAITSTQLITTCLEPHRHTGGSGSIRTMEDAASILNHLAGPFRHRWSQTTSMTALKSPEDPQAVRRIPK